MKVSLSWLTDYVAIDRDIADLAEALTMAGLEVEGIADRYAYLAGVVVGRISEIGPHPHADKLVLCRVDDGRGERSIVCGARNFKETDMVPVALPGAQLPGGKIEAGQIRGIVSDGMLCSEAELALGPDASGILILPETLTPGTELAVALKLSDPVIEFDLTPNRPDCLNIVGIAREVSAISGNPLKLPPIKLTEAATAIDELTSVTIHAPRHCPRYAARVVSDIDIRPSPFWLEDRLNSIGLRAINNVVAVTNFVLMEMGQPLHAFDFDRLAENRIIVDTAQKGQAFTTLDGVERRLPDEALMICDGKGPVALAGIMGGLESEIEDTTKNVLIESAYFNPTTIRRTAKKLGLSTEASYRFERGIDPQGVITALNRAAQLICELAGGDLARGIIDNYPIPVRETEIELSTRATNRLLGTDFEQDRVSSYLERVQLQTSPLDGDCLRVRPPSFRVDLKRPQDLMEEVARLSGYNHIATTHPPNQMVAGKQDPPLRVRRQLKRVFSGCGFSEIISYSFIDRDACDKLLLADSDERRKLVSILNPLTEAQDVMRTSLIPGLFGAVLHNMTQQNATLRLYEVGKTFFAQVKAELPAEREMVSGLWTGNRQEKTWYAQPERADFYDVKGVIEALADALNIPALRFDVPNGTRYPYYETGAVAEVFAGEKAIGVVGKISSRVLRNFELKQDVFCFELDFESLVTLAALRRCAKPISRFPSTTRDIALILDKDVKAQDILDLIEGQGHDLVEGARIFDVYKGPPIPDDKKSVALRLTYCSLERSLTDEEVNAVHEDLTRRILDRFKAQLPSE